MNVNTPSWRVNRVSYNILFTFFLVQGITPSVSPGNDALEPDARENRRRELNSWSIIAITTTPTCCYYHMLNMTYFLSATYPIHSPTCMSLHYLHNRFISPQDRIFSLFALQFCWTSFNSRHVQQAFQPSTSTTYRTGKVGTFLNRIWFSAMLGKTPLHDCIHFVTLGGLINRASTTWKKHRRHHPHIVQKSFCEDHGKISGKWSRLIRPSMNHGRYFCIHKRLGYWLQFSGIIICLTKSWWNASIRRISIPIDIFSYISPVQFDRCGGYLYIHGEFHVLINF